MQKIILRSAGLLNVEIDSAGAGRDRDPTARHAANGEQPLVGARLRAGKADGESQRIWPTAP
jgi:hypothetical protein